MAPELKIEVSRPDENGKRKALALKLFDVPYSDHEKVLTLDGASWDPDITGCISIKRPKKAIRAVMLNLPDVTLSPGALKAYNRWFGQAKEQVPFEHIPETVANIKSDKKLREYQRRMVSWAVDRKRSIWGVDMRLGKTFSSISLCEHLGLKKILVVVPASVRWNWFDEIHEFCEEPQPVTILDGTKKKRDKLIEEYEGGYMVASFETVKNSMEWDVTEENGVKVRTLKGGPLNDIDWDIIIVDEFHKIKNADSLRGEAVRSIRPDRILLMSGTPMPNGIHEIWSPMNYLNPHWFSSHHAFLNTYCKFKTVTYGKEDDPKARKIRKMVGYKVAVSELQEDLHTYMLRIKYEEVVPQIREQVTEVPRFVELTATQRRMYKQLQKDGGYWKNVKDDDGNWQKVWEETALALATRFKRICGSPALVDKKAAHESAKVTEAIDIIESLGVGEQVVIMTQYPELAKFVSKALTKAKISNTCITSDILEKDRGPMRKAFQAGKTQVCVTTIGISQMGLRFDAANTLIFFDAVYVPADMKQATFRILDPENSEKVTVYHLIARDSIEQRVYEILTAKQLLISFMVDGELEGDVIQVDFSGDAVRQELRRKAA